MNIKELKKKMKVNLYNLFLEFFFFFTKMFLLYI